MSIILTILVWAAIIMLMPFILIFGMYLLQVALIRQVCCFLSAPLFCLKKTIAPFKWLVQPVNRKNCMNCCRNTPPNIPRSNRLFSPLFFLGESLGWVFAAFFSSGVFIYQNSLGGIFV